MLQHKRSNLSEQLFRVLTNYCIYNKKSRNTTSVFPPTPTPILCQKAELAYAHRKPQVIFHLSMCGIFHVLVMPAAPFIVWAGSTNDEWVINLAHDVTDLAPVRQRRWGAKRRAISQKKKDFPAAIKASIYLQLKLYTLVSAAKENTGLFWNTTEFAPPIPMHLEVHS